MKKFYIITILFLMLASIVYGIVLEMVIFNIVFGTFVLLATLVKKFYKHRLVSKRDDLKTKTVEND